MTRAHMVTAVTLILKLVLGGIFFVAGVMKLDNPSAFAEEIGNYQLFKWTAPYVAATLPMIEVMVGVVLILWPRRSPLLHAAAVVAAALMAVFTVATALVLYRGINISCGCFGGDSGPVGASTVVRDVLLFLVAVGLLAIGRISARAAAQTPAAPTR